MTIQKIILPARADFLGVKPGAVVSNESDRDYNVHCTNMIRERLLAEREPGGYVRPRALTFYPGDTEETADLVTLGDDDEIVVLARGAE